MTINQTAIVLFVFNRYEHTKKTIEGLKKNNIEKLHVFCDGPRNSREEKEVLKVQKLVDEIDWCIVEKVYQSENIGLAQSVINGVTNVFDKGYEKIIVLEDDCTPDSNFIKYMNDSLEYYKNNSRVMHISGFGLPIKKYTQSDVFLTPYPCSWGWGTWKDVWEKCDFQLHIEYEKLLSNPTLKKKFNYAGEGFSKFLSYQLEGKVNSWLIRWYYYIFANDGLCVWNYNSLIANNGFDGSGVHKVKRDRFNQKSLNISKTGSFKFEDDLELNPALIREFRRFFIGDSLTEKIKTYIYIKTGLLIERKIR